MTDTPRTRRVLMSEELFQQLGATSVEWGKPDKEGFYTPTVYRVTPWWRVLIARIFRGGCA